MEKQTIELTKNELDFLYYIRGVRERAKGDSKSEDYSGTTTAQGKEYSIKVDIEDIRALFKVVRMIQDLHLETDWAMDYLDAYEEIRDQIKKDVID